jgi:hypothetical protein
MIVGGFRSQVINEQNQKKTNELVMSYLKGNGLAASSFEDLNKTLVFYSTQVVAGLNHVIVYEVEASQAKQYICYRFY